MIDIRIYFWCNVVVCIFGLAGTLVGVLTEILHNSKSSIELPECQDFQGDERGVDTLNTFVFTMSKGAIGSGFLTLLSGILGILGSRKHEPGKAILVSVGLVGVVLPLACLLVVLGSGIGSTITGECDTRECNPSTGHCNKIGCQDLGVGTRDCLGWCKSDYEYFCDDLPPYFIGIAIIPAPAPP